MKNNLHKWAAGALTILMAFALVAVVLLQGTPAASRPAAQESGLNPDQQEIAQLKELLTKPDLSADARRSLEEKLEMAERMANQRIGSSEVRSTKVALVEPLAAQFLEEEPQPDEEGIFDGSEGLIRPSLADINNLWQGSRSGKFLQVFAGSFSESRGGEGVLIVIEPQPDLPYGPMETYPAPEGSGPLRIQEVGESEVILLTTSGDRLIFDLVARTYK